MNNKILVTIWLILGMCWKCSGLGLGPAIKEVPELTDALKCEIHLGTNTVVFGSNVPIVLTISNNTNIEAQLASPASRDPTINLRLLMYYNNETNARPLIIPVTFFEGLPTAEDKKIWEKGPVGYNFLSPRWIVVPPHGKVDIDGCINVSTPLFGTNHLHCVIRTSSSIYNSPAIYITNEWFNIDAHSPENVAKAKKDGLFLLDLKRLWVGKMESNIEEINVLKPPK